MVELDSPGWLKVIGKNRVLTSIDSVSVEPTEGGSVVTYDARLVLRGVLRLADPLLSKAFQKIGGRAEAGLREALSGEIIPT